MRERKIDKRKEFVRERERDREREREREKGESLSFSFTFSTSVVCAHLAQLQICIDIILAARVLDKTSNCSFVRLLICSLHEK